MIELSDNLKYNEQVKNTKVRKKLKKTIDFK